MVKKHGVTPQEAKVVMRKILNELMSRYEQGYDFGEGNEGDEDPTGHNTSGEFFEYYGKLYPKPNHGPGRAKYIRWEGIRN